MPIAINELPQDVDACHSLIQEMYAAFQKMHAQLQQSHVQLQESHAQLQQPNKDIELLKQQVQYLVRARFGKKSEKVDSNPDQLRLFSLPALEPEIKSQEEQTINTVQHLRKGHGRKKRDLPRIRQ